MNINKHEGRKYLRTIHPADGVGQPIQVDVYEVLRAFEVVCPAQAHALKKVLLPGGRGKGTRVADLVGAIAAINRAIEFTERNAQWEGVAKGLPPGAGDCTAHPLGMPGGHSPFTPILQPAIKAVAKEASDMLRAGLREAVGLPPQGCATPPDNLGQATTCPPGMDWASWAKDRIKALEEELEATRQRLLSAAGDDLCRLTPEEIKAMSAGGTKIPPKEEFLESCERFHAQVAKETGVLP